MMLTTESPAEIRRSAVISKCQRYRYALRREWQDDLPEVLFVALNPSTANGEVDDPTVRRCVGFAKSWGFGKLVIANLFAFRSSDPSKLLLENDPIGPLNDKWLSDLSGGAELTIAAWGIHGDIKQRATEVLPILRNVHHLGLTNAGHPRHPLYLPKSAQPTRY